MKIIYAGEKFPERFSKSIFLAGPTPRKENVESWRKQALLTLEAKKFDGVVFVPEPRDGKWKKDYDEQVEWEGQGLNMADCIIFWIPRDPKNLPGFTTNIEYGDWMKSGKVVLGAPEKAFKMDYLRHKAGKYFIPQADNLKETIDKALEFVGDGAQRSGGECQVPLYIWKTPSFQSWYKAQTNAGNRLDGARVEWTFRVGPEKKFVFFWILHVNVFIAKENRNKTNEVVLSRPDIATVMLYCPGKDIIDTDVVLIREFRSPASTVDGYVWEIPGGSSFKPKEDPSILAAHEVHEETGLKISPDRIIWHEARQIAGTLSAHKAHLFSAEINIKELEWLRLQAGVAHGVVEDTERTYVEVVKLADILYDTRVDWSMLGMILAVLTRRFNK